MNAQGQKRNVWLDRKHLITYAVVVIGLAIVYFAILSYHRHSQQTNTVAGIDANNNGIRDDIEQYISDKYASEPNIIPILNAYAKANQSFMLYPNYALMYDTERDKATECLVSIKGGDNGYRIRDDLRSKILNTSQRNQAYDIADKNLSGHIFAPPPIPQWSKSCNGIIYQEMVIYLDKKYPNDIVNNFKILLEKQDWVAYLEFKTAEQAMADFKTSHKNDPILLETLKEFTSEDNPLPAYFDISIKGSKSKDDVKTFINAQPINLYIDKIR